MYDFKLLIAFFLLHFVFQIREDIVKGITQLRLNDTTSVNQIAGVLVEATTVELEVTAESGASIFIVSLSNLVVLVSPFKDWFC